MVSAIDATKPLDGVPAVKSELRGNLQAAKTEIENLQDNGATIISSSAVVKDATDPTKMLEFHLERIASNTTRTITMADFDLDLANCEIFITPRRFAQNTIGDGTVRLLSTDYADIDAAKLAYPHISGEIDDAGNLTNMTHDWAAIQSMFNYVQNVLGAQKTHMYIPAGRYMIRDTLKMLKGDTFRTGSVTGAGQGYGAAREGTTIDATFFVDRPILAIQGARVASVDGICFRGGELAPLNQTGFYRKDLSDYITPGVSTGRYNPYAGIAIDPYTVDPGGGQGYPNDPYGRLASSTVFVTNCRIEQCHVAVVVSPSNHDANADQIVVDKCFMHYNALQLSSGSSQNRMLKCINSYSFKCHTISVNNRHGIQNGNCFSIDNMTAVLSYDIIDWSDSDPASINYLHAEQFARIGTWRGGPLRLALNFRTSHLKFFFDPAQETNPPAFHMEIDAGTVDFSSCHFQQQSADVTKDLGHFNIVGSGKAILSGGTNFYTPGVITRPIIAYGFGFSPVPTFRDAQYQSVGSPDGLQYANETQTYTGGGLFAMGDRVQASYTTSFVKDGADLYRFQPGSPVGGIFINFSNFNVTPTQVTFDSTQAGDFMVGDVLALNCQNPATGNFFYVPAARISGIVGNAVTCDLVVKSEEVNAAPLGIILVQENEFAPKASPQATCSTASANITFASDVSSIFNERDFIQGDAGTWTRYRVQSVSGDGLTITLNKNAPVTNAAVSMFWGRLHQITGTPV